MTTQNRQKSRTLKKIIVSKATTLICFTLDTVFLRFSRRAHLSKAIIETKK